MKGEKSKCLMLCEPCVFTLEVLTEFIQSKLCYFNVRCKNKKVFVDHKEEIIIRFLQDLSLMPF